MPRLRGLAGLVCLTGDWADGQPLITWAPLATVSGLDAFPALDVVPVVDGADAAAVGGGWFGVLGYDGRHHVAFHDWVLRLAEGQWWFESLHSEARAADIAAARDVAAAALSGSSEPVAASVGTVDGPSRDAHLAAVERAIEFIRAGDIYQVNVCTRLSAEFSGEPTELFARVASTLRPARGAFVDMGARQVASLSPELFLSRRGRYVRTAPIKGTRPRIGSDVSGSEELRRSAKDAAENVMIVDLMRNDLGRVSVTGTVAADALLDVEAHPGVWHLVSRVHGRLREGVGDAELLDATFPPGSVTGAPKLRATEVIGLVEIRSRGAYTGAIGFTSPTWGAEFNVAIRTFEIADGRLELGVGGGITADSVPMLEWQECLHKAAPLLGAAGATLTGQLAAGEPVPTTWQRDGGVLETVLVLDGRPVRLADHLARMDRSLRELYGRGLPAQTAAEARVVAASAGSGRAVLRLVAAAADLSLTCSPAAEAPLGSVARTVTGRIGLWRHKWADRDVLAAYEADARGAVPLFVAADGTVLETSRGNVFVLGTDGTLVTPPLRDDLLPGVTRQALLDLAHDAGRPVELRPVTVADLVAGTPFWTSSLSLAVPITAVDDVPTLRDDDAVASFAAALRPPPPNPPHP